MWPQGPHGVLHVEHLPFVVPCRPQSEEALAEPTREMPTSGSQLLAAPVWSSWQQAQQVLEGMLWAESP